MAPTTVVLSPHLDDAALSCWHLLAGGGDVLVINVFAGVPEPGSLAWWDGLTGASDSARRMLERRAEDADVLSLVGARGENLELLDAQYRTNGVTPAIAEHLAGRVEGADAVYAPAALFPVPDHVLVRDAALALREDVRLYADLPHAAHYGLPQWVTGQPDELDVDAAWRGRIADAGLDPARLHAEVHALDDEAFAAKLDALRRYRTQIAAVAREAPLERLRWEVTWSR